MVMAVQVRLSRLWYKRDAENQNQNSGQETLMSCDEFVYVLRLMGFNATLTNAAKIIEKWGQANEDGYINFKKFLQWCDLESCFVRIDDASDSNQASENQISEAEREEEELLDAALVLDVGHPDTNNLDKKATDQTMDFLSNVADEYMNSMIPGDNQEGSGEESKVRSGDSCNINTSTQNTSNELMQEIRKVRQEIVDAEDALSSGFLAADEKEETINRIKQLKEMLQHLERKFDEQQSDDEVSDAPDDFDKNEVHYHWMIHNELLENIFTL